MVHLHLRRITLLPELSEAGRIESPTMLIRLRWLNTDDPGYSRLDLLGLRLRSEVDHGAKACARSPGRCLVAHPLLLLCPLLNSMLERL